MQGHCGHDRVVACDGSTCVPSQVLGDQFCDECTAVMAADGAARMLSSINKSHWGAFLLKLSRWSYCAGTFHVV